MKQILLKALTKKKNFLNQKKKEIDYSSYSDSEYDSDSDCSLTSDDEEEVSKDMVFKWITTRYIVLKYLGRGTFCRTWLVYDNIDFKFRALKIYFEEFYEDSLNEIKINNSLKSNNNVVKCVDNFLFEKTNCLVFELLGDTLLDINDFYDNQIPLHILKKTFIQIFMGLNEIHNSNIIHCDIKPENIMFQQPNSNIQKIVNLNNLEETYTKLFNGHLPKDYNTLKKNKKKIIKKKVKTKCNLLFSDFIKQEINKLEFDEEPKCLFNENNFTVKIIDLGNAEFKGADNKEEIMIRGYRPPENIMNNFFNEKADIWSLGCIFYEYLTDEYLFDIERDLEKIEKDREHLFQISEIIGKIPIEYSLNCDYNKELFDKDGRIIGETEYEYLDIAEILEEKHNYKHETADEISRFIKSLLNYNINERLSAKECLENKWLNN